MSSVRKAVASRRFLLTSGILSVLILMMYASTVFSQSPPPQPNCNTLFCLNDAFGSGGNETVQVCGGTNIRVNWFNFWYGASGPWNITGNVTGFNVTAAYANSSNTPYSEVQGITNTTPCVNFVLNGTVAPFTNMTKTINVTAYNGTNYANNSTINCAPGIGCNGTMFTINYVSINTTNATSNGILSNVIFMTYNNATKSFIAQGPAVSDSSGYWAEHCVGVVSGTNCANASVGTPSNNCVTHGTAFPPMQGQQGPNCPINSTVSLLAFDFISSNASVAINATPNPGNAGATILNLNQSSAVGFVMPMLFSLSQGQPSFLNVTSLSVNSSPTNLVYQSQPQGGGNGPQGGPPFFINANQVYNISISIQGLGTFVYPFMAPSSGMTGAQIAIPNSSITQLTNLVGKVVDSSGNALSGVIVYAQQMNSGGGAFGISFINSSVTDANGKFSMVVPSTQQLSCGQGSPAGCIFSNPTYQFYIIGTNISYFPTVDSNNNRGYFAQGSTAVLPPLTLKAGGQVNVNVTLNGAALILSELSKFLTLGTGVTRSDVTGKFSMISMFSNINPPASIIIPFLSPIGNPFVNLFGKNQSFGGPGGGAPVNTTCFNATSLTQGQTQSINCNMTSPGYLNLTVTTCTNIFNCAGGNQTESVGNFGFWFQTNGILRNSTGSAVAYFSPNGVFLQDLLGFGQQQSNATIPLPAGTYTLELAPSFDFSPYLDVYNGTPITITAGSPLNLNMIRGNSWNIQPMFNPSFTFSGSNPLNISVTGSTGPLSNLNVSLNGTVLFLNRTATTAQKIFFGYAGNNFYNSTFNPSTLGLTAGKYLLFINASNALGAIGVDSNSRFSTTMLMPISAYDFQVGLGLNGFVFSPGNISAQIFAYNTSVNPPIGVNASGANVTVIIYDQTGANKTIYFNATTITNGQGNVNITLPSTLGFYEIVTSVTTDNNTAPNNVPCQSTCNGKVGVADNWIQVSNYGVTISTDKTSYQPTDAVIPTVQVINSSSGLPVANANVQLVVDNSNTPAVGITGNDGKFNISLAPNIYSTGGGNWSFGFHNLQAKVSIVTSNNVINLNGFYGFNVRGLNAFVQMNKTSYSTSDAVGVNVFFPPGSPSVSSITAQIDGNSNVTYTGLQSGPNFWQIPITQPPGIGQHNVQITITSGSNTQTYFTGFSVSSYNIIATTDSFSYNQNSLINLTVAVTYAANGSVVSGLPVTATLYKAQSPNDINVTQNTTITSTSGSNSTLLNASQPGFNYIKVNVGGQFQFVGVQVSSIKVSLLTGTGGSVISNYNGAPGSTVTLYVNATSGSNNVADGSTVTASIWAFGNQITLPSNTTASGNATISFQIPSFAPAQVYGLNVIVTDPNGNQGFSQPATLTVTGGSALQLSVNPGRKFLQPFLAGDSATFTATLTYPNGTSASGYNVTFEIGSPTVAAQTMGTAVTSSSGIGTLSASIPSTLTDGPYYLHAYLTNNPTIQAYSGFMVSTLSLNVTVDNPTHQPGDNVNLTITVTNRTSGSQINATSGFVGVFNKNKGQVQQFINTAGQAQPYTINVSIPNDASAIGTFQMGVMMFVNQSQGFGFATVNVINQTLAAIPLNLTLPTITAGTQFLANITSAAGTTASLTIFSPLASSVVYQNTSITLSGIPNATVPITLTYPGVYIFNVFVSGVGSVNQPVLVNSTSGTAPLIWTGSDTSTNATSFSSSIVSGSGVYIFSNIGNSTATVLTLNTTTNNTVSYSVPLTQTSGSNYYGIFTVGSPIVGTYLARLDTSTSSGLATSMFTVTS